MKELHFRSASELGRMLRAREISSAELTEHFISRIEAHNPQINAVVATDFDGARAAAKEADEALAKGDEKGPLHGLPFSLQIISIICIL